MFPVGDDPFDVFLGVDGSGDYVCIDPNGVIPAYSKSDYMGVVA